MNTNTKLQIITTPPPPPPRVQLDYSHLLLHLFLGLLLLISFSQCNKGEDSPTPIPTVKYLVTFDTDGGSKIDPITVDEKEKAAKPTDPTKEGFTFEGWFTDEATTIPFNFDTPITSDTTLYAKWTAIINTVSFNTNGGTPITSRMVRYGSQTGEPTPPTKEGFFFDGWFADEATTIPFNFDNPITSDATLYAKWSLLYYTLFFEQGTVRSTIVSYDITINIEGEDDPIVFSKSDKSAYTLTNYPPSTLYGKKLSVEVKAYKEGEIEVGTAEQDFDLNRDETLLSLPLETVGYTTTVIVDYAALKAYVRDPSRMPNQWEDLALNIMRAYVYETREDPFSTYEPIVDESFPAGADTSPFTKTVNVAIEPYVSAKAVKFRVKNTSSNFAEYYSEVITIDPIKEGEENVVRITMPNPPGLN